MDQPDRAAFLIVDERHLQRPEFPLIKFIDGWETVEEMESALGLPAGNLRATLDRYNRHAALGRIRTSTSNRNSCAPGHGALGRIRSVAGQGDVLGFTVGGLATDVDGRCFGRTRPPSPGSTRLGRARRPSPKTARGTRVGRSWARGRSSAAARHARGDVPGPGLSVGPHTRLARAAVHFHRPSPISRR